MNAISYPCFEPSTDKAVGPLVVYLQGCLSFFLFGCIKRKYWNICLKKMDEIHLCMKYNWFANTICIKANIACAMIYAVMLCVVYCSYDHRSSCILEMHLPMSFRVVSLAFMSQWSNHDAYCKTGHRALYFYHYRRRYRFLVIYRPNLLLWLFIYYKLATEITVIHSARE